MLRYQKIYTLWFLVVLPPAAFLIIARTVGKSSSFTWAAIIWTSIFAIGYPLLATGWFTTRRGVKTPSLTSVRREPRENLSLISRFSVEEWVRAAEGLIDSRWNLKDSLNAEQLLRGVLRANPLDASEEGLIADMAEIARPQIEAAARQLQKGRNLDEQASIEILQGELRLAALATLRKDFLANEDIDLLFEPLMQAGI